MEFWRCLPTARPDCSISATEMIPGDPKRVF